MEPTPTGGPDQRPRPGGGDAGPAGVTRAGQDQWRLHALVSAGETGGMELEATARPRASRLERVRPAARRHWLFLATLFVGFSLRVLAQVAYRPALLFIDSFRYLANLNFDPTRSEPVGYPVIVLRPMLSVFGNLASVVALQHLLGLCMGVALYWVLLRRGSRPWLAALATMPILLDAYQIQIEQNILSEVLFEALILATVVLLLWVPRPGLWALVAAGVLLGVAVTVRIVAFPLVVPAALFAAGVSPPGWSRLRRGGALALAFTIPVAAYAGYYYSATHRVGLTSADGAVIAGRAEVIVDCRGLSLPPYERVLCPKEPLGHRKSVEQYAHDSDRPAVQLHPPPGRSSDQVLRDFAIRVFRHQPADFAGAVLGDFAKGFAWSPTTSPGDPPVQRWQFQRSYPTFPPLDAASTIQAYGGGGPSVVRPLATFLRDYQLTVGFVPGPLLAFAFPIGILGAAGLGRARRSGLRAACLLPTVFGLGLLLTGAVYEFSWRYQLPALVFGPLGGALGLTALTFGSPARPGVGDNATPAEPSAAGVQPAAV